MEDLTSARQALKNEREKLLSCANVVATGVGYKVTKGQKTTTPSLICSVTEKVALGKLTERDRIPATIAGIPTDVIPTGPIRVFQSHTDRFRPAPGGVSIGHRDITAGTLGCLVKKDGQTMILSNNHVLANSNDANIGDAILQPGPHDGGRDPEDRIATLSSFAPISFPEAPSGCNIANAAAGLLNSMAQLIGSKERLRAVSTQASDNLVDAAIAKPINEQDVSNEILKIGTIQGVTSGELGMAIKKSGRTTELTSGTIEQVDVTVNVQYGAGRIARFTDQLIAGAMSQGGDSGSAVLDEENRLVGLLFAGSDNSTIINRIEHVFTTLDIGL